MSIPYLNTKPGLAPALDTLADLASANAQNDAQLRGLAAGGLIPPSMAPGPSMLSRLIGGDQPSLMPGALGQPGASASPASAPQDGRMSGDGLIPAIGQLAQKHGIDPMVALRAIRGESGGNPNAVGDNGSSFGLLQLHYAGMAPGGNSGAGMGDDYTRTTGRDARDPANALDALDYALGRVSKEGWGAFHAAAKAGIGRWDGISRGQPAGGSPMPQATADTAMPPQALAFSGSQPPAAPPNSPGAGGAAPVAPASASAGGGGAGAPPPGGGAPPAMSAGSRLNGMISLPQIQAMIANPQTRAQGLQLWQLYLQPPQMSFGKAGEGVFSNGRYVGQVPSAPMDVAPGNSVVDPNTGRVIAATSPKLEHTEVGTDAFGQKQFGTFNPQTGVATPFPGAPGVMPQAPGAGGPDAPQLSGDAFLKTLPPAIAGQVKAIAEGRVKLQGGMGSNSPLAQRLRAYVQQYDPTFDQADVDARFKTRQDFAAGGPSSAASAITAGNTAIQHLGELSDAAEELHNSGIPLWNHVTQALGTHAGGNIAGTKFANILGKYVEEATKFYRGTGGTEADIERDIHNLSSYGSPDQLRAGIGEQVKLMQGKINALQDRWHQGMGAQAGDYPIVQPKSQEALDKITGRAAPAGGAGTQKAATAPQRLTVEQARALPPGTPFVDINGISRVRH